MGTAKQQQKLEADVCFILLYYFIVSRAPAMSCYFSAVPFMHSYVLHLSHIGFTPLRSVRLVNRIDHASMTALQAQYGTGNHDLFPFQVEPRDLVLTQVEGEELEKVTI